MKTAVSLVAIGQTLLWGGLYYIFPALLLDWEQSYGWSRPEMTFALALAVIVSALFAPIAGAQIDKGRGVLLLTGSALLGSLLLPLLPFAENLTTFYLIWAAIGVAMAGCLYEPCFAFMVYYHGEQAKRSITLVTLAAGFASTICFPAANYLSDLIGVDQTVRVIAAVLVFIAVPALGIGSHLMKNGSTLCCTAEPTTLSKSTVTILKRPLFWFLALGFSFMALNHGALLNHFLPLVRDRGLSAELSILAVSMIGPMQVAGRMVWMAFDKKLKLLQVTLACFLSLTLASIALWGSANWPVLIAAFVLLQGSAYGVVSIIKPLVAREVMGPGQLGKVTGLMAVPYLLCFALSPYAASLLWEEGGYDLVILASTTCCLLSMGCLITVIRKHRTETVSADPEKNRPESQRNGKNYSSLKALSIWSNKGLTK